MLTPSTSISYVPSSWNQSRMTMCIQVCSHSSSWCKKLHISMYFYASLRISLQGTKQIVMCFGHLVPNTIKLREVLFPQLLSSILLTKHILPSKYLRFLQKFYTCGSSSCPSSMLAIISNPPCSSPKELQGPWEPMSSHPRFPALSHHKNKMCNANPRYIRRKRTFGQQTISSTSYMEESWRQCQFTVISTHLVKIMPSFLSSPCLAKLRSCHWQR